MAVRPAPATHSATDSVGFGVMGGDRGAGRELCRDPRTARSAWLVARTKAERLLERRLVSGKAKKQAVWQGC